MGRRLHERRKPPSRLPEEGLEPSLPCGNGILNPARLPIPPLRRRGASCPQTYERPPSPAAAPGPAEDSRRVVLPASRFRRPPFSRGTFIRSRFGQNQGSTGRCGTWFEGSFRQSVRGRRNERCPRTNVMRNVSASAGDRLQDGRHGARVERAVKRNCDEHADGTHVIRRLPAESNRAIETEQSARPRGTVCPRWDRRRRSTERGLDQSDS